MTKREIAKKMVQDAKNFSKSFVAEKNLGKHNFQNIISYATKNQIKKAEKQAFLKDLSASKAQAELDAWNLKALYTLNGADFGFASVINFIAENGKIKNKKLAETATKKNKQYVVFLDLGGYKIMLSVVNEIPTIIIKKTDIKDLVRKINSNS